MSAPMVEANVPRVLVVDDEVPQMKALCETLKEHGYAPAGYDSGEAALEALRNGAQFDLLLTDLMMPKLDGIALLQAALKFDPDLVGVIMTGKGTIATAVEAMKAGALDYILKPFKLSAILPVLARSLGVRRLRMENAELARQVAQRTAELEAANQELEAFSYSVSHDLRAPLRAIKGFSEILVHDHARDMSDEARRLLEIVTTNGRRMEELIEDLLRFSRLNRQYLSKRTVDLPALVREVLEEVRNDYAGRPVDVKVRDLPECHADPSLLRQVLINLLSNAFKFTRKRDHAEVEIGCRSEAGERIFFVKDNGAGFDMRQAQKLFGVFQRLHRADEFEGTGIGLSLAHRIVQRHGGRIWAEAEIGKGATFFFSLPAPAVPR